MIDSFMQDGYDLCDSFSHVLDRRYTKSAWADVAEKLKSRLPSQATSKKDRATTDFPRSYQRERLSGWIIEALEASGENGRDGLSGNRKTPGFFEGLENAGRQDKEARKAANRSLAVSRSAQSERQQLAS